MSVIALSLIAQMTARESWRRSLLHNSFRTSESLRQELQLHDRYQSLENLRGASRSNPTIIWLRLRDLSRPVGDTGCPFAGDSFYHGPLRRTGKIHRPAVVLVRLYEGHVRIPLDDHRPSSGIHGTGQVNPSCIECTSASQMSDSRALGRTAPYRASRATRVDGQDTADH